MDSNEIASLTSEFKTELRESGFGYSDEFLYSLIKQLKERIDYLEKGAINE